MYCTGSNRKNIIFRFVRYLKKSMQMTCAASMREQKLKIFLFFLIIFFRGLFPKKFILFGPRKKTLRPGPVLFYGVSRWPPTDRVPFIRYRNAQREIVPVHSPGSASAGAYRTIKRTEKKGQVRFASFGVQTHLRNEFYFSSPKNIYKSNARFSKCI